MGVIWSDVLYPDNPKRRDEVNRLAQSIRIHVDQIFAHVRTMSMALHKACNKFQVLDPLDLDLTYQANFNKLELVLQQWQSVTREMEMDPSIPQQIKALLYKFEEATSVGQFPDIVKDIMSEPSLAGQISEPVASLLFGTIATYFAQIQLTIIVSSTVAALSIAGIVGVVVGAAVGMVVSIIIGAIEGAQERDHLEKLIRDYKAMDQNLQDHLEALQDGVTAVIRAIYMVHA